MKLNNRYGLLVLLIFLGACDSSDNNKDKVSVLPELDDVLSNKHECSPTIAIRTQALNKALIERACVELTKQETYFHDLFQTKGKPVKDDNNDSLRANFYANKQEYDKYAGVHFNIPVNNGGMYLEGIPSNKDNQAEFIAFVRQGEFWNLEHEYIHYLDGRFNVYGDFCAFPHDSHSPPENCPEPHPPYPHFVWWTEGIANYITDPRISARMIRAIQEKPFNLSELFNTSYVENGGETRVYTWGLLAVRFMMENHRTKIDVMLEKTRVNDWDAYRHLIAEWGTNLDDEFSVWLKSLKVEK